MRPNETIEHESRRRKGGSVFDVMLLLLSLIGPLRAEVHNAIVDIAFRDYLPSDNIPET